MPIIINLESQNLLDEQTSSLLKTLILEENYDIFKLINSFIARAIDEHALCAKLIRLAQQMGTYMERPMSPIPKNKKQLLSFVNSMAEYHFTDKEDLDLLNKLIQEENEFVLSCFAVFDSDKDHENLIDSLQRILDKSKASGAHSNKITPSAFYQNYAAAGAPGEQAYAQHMAAQNNRSFTHATPQPNHSFGQGPFMPQNGLRPDTSQWAERPPPIQQARDTNPLYKSLGQPSNTRSQSLAKSGARRNRAGHQGGPNPRDLSHNVMRFNQSNIPQFLPPVTHYVDKKQGYFSSDDEEREGISYNKRSKAPYQQYPAQGAGRHAFGANNTYGYGKGLRGAMMPLSQPGFDGRGHPGDQYYASRNLYSHNPSVSASGGRQANYFVNERGQYFDTENEKDLKKRRRGANRPQRGPVGYPMNNYLAESHDERSNQYPDPRFEPDYSRMVNSYVMEDYPEDMGYGPPYNPQMPGAFHPNQFWKPPKKKASKTKGRSRGKGKSRPNRKYSSEDQLNSYDDEEDFNQRSVQIYDREDEDNSDSSESSLTDSRQDSSQSSPPGRKRGGRARDARRKQKSKG